MLDSPGHKFSMQDYGIGTLRRKILKAKDKTLRTRHTSRTGIRPFINFTNKPLKLNTRHASPEQTRPFIQMCLHKKQLKQRHHVKKH
jgi:hypothetical protein